MVRAWIYSPKKAEFTQYGIEFGIQLTSTLAAMRREFHDLIPANEGHLPQAGRLNLLARKHAHQFPLEGSTNTIRVHSEDEFRVK